MAFATKATTTKATTKATPTAAARPHIKLTGIGSAKVTKHSNPLSFITHRDEDGTESYSPAEFLLEITKCEVIRTTLKQRTAFIATFRVLESGHPQIRAGEERTWYQDMDQPSGPGALKAFILAAIGATTDEEIESASAEMDDNLDDVYGEEQSLAGRHVGVRVSRLLTRENKPFSLHSFSAVASD